MICLYDILSFKPAVLPKTKKLVLEDVEEPIFFKKKKNLYAQAIFRNFELLQME